MKQVYISKYGSPDVLKVRDIELPPLKSKEIQIDTKYAGINFSEIMARMKLYPGAPKPPCGIGAEASGIITALGENVKGGEPVFVPKSKDSDEDDGWVLVLAHEEEEAKSKLLVIDSQDFESPPVAEIYSPQRIPYGAHGNWMPAN